MSAETQSDRDHLREWIGRTETRVDVVTPAPIAALSATLDCDMPRLLHWTAAWWTGPSS